ncbi:MAG: transcription-repair coupling factor, partial [Lachnospiraceae bacterium]|nr:transcription-repair coupling factor [Lachnospiraceae bacterium]
VRIKEHVDAVELEFQDSMSNRLEKGYILPGQTKLLYPAAEVAAGLARKRVLALSMMEIKCSLFPVKVHFEVEAKMVSPYNHSFETLVKDLAKYRRNKYRMVLLSPSRTRARRLAENLRDNDIPAAYSEDPFREAIVGEVLCLVGNVARGFEYPLLHFVVIAESDIFGAEKRKKKKKSGFSGTKIQDFAELHVGDYVVHELYGLGQYQGIEKVEVDHIIKDYIKLAYRDNGNVYVPATGLHILQKYGSADAKPPKLSKLGSKEWAKTKQKVRTAVESVAKDLVELYAHRQQAEGFQYGPDTVWQREFEEMFPYEETPDQLAAIEATKSDMESRKIMDRLICGDVGYGKTEVAIRAAFKAVQEGKQVVYLVPTTILAQQHYHTFVQRMKEYPVRVDLMCRFRTPSEQKRTLADLKKGFVDIVIGTHRVLSKDMEFKDLGLLIIDEEQRFGVSDKEKIKKLKENVDVLTLTATPIPRTLHMSLIGVRDMSLLEEAPQDRLPIQTYVMEHNDEMVREAIVRELTRGGQVFYVYNRVNDIDQVALQVQQLVPEATVSFAHGQMKEHELERIMYDFVNGDIDVLVSTTIIETGMDISNANTMIIHDADSLGLSQLYQLRGRVGRSNRTAYAFMMYKRGKLLKEVAEKRLQAIKEFTDLGSGFKIAMRDLEIRGAGNLLGKAQHGHMEAVGYDMYCKMLNQAVMTAQGKKVAVDFDTKVDVSADAFIPAEYILNEVQKLDIYKRIAGVETPAEKEDMLQELQDRFGNVPTPVDNLLRINLLRVRAHRMYMTDVRSIKDRIQFVVRPDAHINPDLIPAFVKSFKGSMTFAPMGNPTFTYRCTLTGMVEKDAQIILGACEEVLERMEQEIYTV